MDITPYVDSLRRDLLAAAEAAGPEARAAAERLTFALDPAARLALMEAISQAAAEITAEMPAGGVDVRLDGRELAFVVARPAGRPAPPAPPPPPPAGAEEAEEEGGIARITLRHPRVGQDQGRGVRGPVRPLAQHLAGQRRPRAPPARARSTSTSTCPASRSSAATTRSAARRRGGKRSRRMTGWV